MKSVPVTDISGSRSLAWSALLLCLLWVSGCTPSAEVRQPNVLFVLTDDQSWLHTSYLGEPQVRTPNFDRIAREGLYLSHAYVSAPSCTPSRSAILAGQHFWRLGSAGVLWGAFGADTLSYQRLLAESGYHIGHTGKGWGPGSVSGGDPVGRSYNEATLSERVSEHVSAIDYAGNFAAFLDDRAEGTPFSFWFSPFEPHRPYEGRTGIAAGIDPGAIRVPPFLPDNPVVRSDLADYYLEIYWQDQALGSMLDELEARDLLDNTLIVVTSDNGMPFPRAKANSYDTGARVPLAIRWGERIDPGSVSDALVNLSDLAPTFLAAAGIEIPIQMTGRNLLPLFDAARGSAGSDAGIAGRFAETVTGFERHNYNARAGNTAYPSRALHTARYTLIHNYFPERWPVGDPPDYRDIDSTSPTRDQVLADERFLALAAARRPEFELYDRQEDPFQLDNLAAVPAFADLLESLHGRLRQQLLESGDPILGDDPDSFSSQPYFGP